MHYCLAIAAIMSISLANAQIKVGDKPTLISTDGLLQTDGTPIATTAISGTLTGGQIILTKAGGIRFSNALMPNDNPGQEGQFLTSQGAGVAPIWTTAATGGGGNTGPLGSGSNGDGQIPLWKACYYNVGAKCFTNYTTIATSPGSNVYPYNCMRLCKNLVQGGFGPNVWHTPSLGDAWTLVMDPTSEADLRAKSIFYFSTTTYSTEPVTPTGSGSIAMTYFTASNGSSHWGWGSDASGFSISACVCVR